MKSRKIILNYLLDFEIISVTVKLFVEFTVWTPRMFLFHVGLIDFIIFSPYSDSFKTNISLKINPYPYLFEQSCAGLMYLPLYKKILPVGLAYVHRKRQDFFYEEASYLIRDC